MKWLIIVLVLSVQTQLILADALTKYEIYGAKSWQFAWSDVCQTMDRGKDLLFTDAWDQSSLNCMGKRTLVIDFCKRKLPDVKNWVRGGVDQKLKMATCSAGHRVELAYRTLPEKTKCDAIRPILAHDLEVAYQLYRQSEGELVCHFMEKNYL